MNKLIFFNFLLISLFRHLNYSKCMKPKISLQRYKRYIGLSRSFKLNRRYQECVGPGDIQGHCKHAIYCQTDVTAMSKNVLDYLCVIAKTHIGVCCPDDILLATAQGSLVIKDLPASGTDYDDDDKNSGCGLPSMAGSTSKSPQTLKRWPWIAVLYEQHKPEEQFCGGALITDKHILTAAHCFINIRKENIRVRLGEYDFLRRNETRSKDFLISSLITHEEFNSASFENDLAIVRLQKPTTFNSYIWPICLPPINRSFENETVAVAGWGQVYYGGPTSETLLEISVPVWPQQKCIDSYAQRITENNMCAAGYDGDLDSCKGDSGSPLLYQLENGRWVAIGIVSWGIGCGLKTNPGVYTRVNKYLPWILTHTLTN
nr:venom protease-like [Onthophagus taurus]